MTVRQKFIFFSFLSSLLTLIASYFWPPVLWVFLILVPIIALGIYDMIQTRRTILRLYPVIGHFRYILESFRKEIQQYFVESDVDETPISREFRSLVYQRAKDASDTRPFGTIFDVNRAGYEWVNHSLNAKHLTNHGPRIQFGGDDCTQPYMASPFNISAMSFDPAGIAEEIKKHIADFEITYAPDFRQEIASNWPASIDDKDAREDWGWNHEYDLSGMVEDMLKNLRNKLGVSA